MKILLYTQLWKRPELTDLVLKQITGIKKEGYEFIPFAVLSEESMKPICEKYGVKYVYTENLPLGRKHNVGLDKALELEWDYCFNFGSDDLVSSQMFDLYDPYFKKGVDFFGLNDVWFYDVYTSRLCHYSYPRTKSVFGAGRVCSRNMIDKIKGNSKRLVFWEDHRNSGLDNSSRRKAEEFGFKNQFVSTKEPLIIDVKTDVNIWGYDNYKGNEKDFEELNGYYESDILELLTKLETEKPRIKSSRTMSNVTKVYEHLRASYSRYKRTGHEDVEFLGGVDKGQDGFQGGKLVTSDPELQEWAERHPEFGKRFVLRKEIEPGSTKQPEAPAKVEPVKNKVIEPVKEPLVADEVNSASAAKMWLKENTKKVEEHCGVAPDANDTKNSTTIKDFVDKHNIKFPNFFKD